MKRSNKFKYAILYYIFFPFSVFFYNKQKNTWLISERGDEARDNGYYFYRYLKEKHPNIDVKYVITKDSKDINMINKEDIVLYRSFKHYLYFINSKYLISTHNMGFSPLFWVFVNLDTKGLIYTHGKRIFLQHGITYNTVPSLVKKKIDLFFTVAEEETKFVIDKFGYNDKIVKCIGFPRFDYFENNIKDYILIMPTWRRDLNGVSKEDFHKSEYFSKWSSLLKNDKFNKLLDQNNIKVLFYPHYEMQKYIDLFETNNKNIIMARAEQYSIHDLLDECKMFVTDYSSTNFDVAYNDKPLIYYQFDYSSFYSIHYGEGYLNLKENGFGPVVETEEDFVKEFEKIINNKYKNQTKYTKRIKEFYKNNDRNNCDRVYDEIINLK